MRSTPSALVASVKPKYDESYLVVTSTGRGRKALFLVTVYV